jgi:Flp pilus assembly protein TadG
MRLVRSWWAAASGNVGVAFALTVIPLCAVLGVAIDYLRASNLRLDLQGVVDGAVLAAGAEGSDDEAVLRNTISLYIDANLQAAHRTALGAVRISFGKPATIRVEAEAVSQNALLKLVGIDRTSVAVASEAVQANPLEVALVLDNTGSMLGTREAALRKAVRELADTLMIDVADVKMALVPFSQYVNVGIEYRTASWIKLPEIPADETWMGCIRSRLLGLDTTDGSPDKPYPVLTQQASLAPNQFCPTPLTPLTADKSVVIAAMNGMVMSGQTYIPAGLMWGWNVLTHYPPFTEARAKGVRKAMVLMTDGANSRSHFAFGYHEAKDIAAAIRTMLTLCTNIKQAGIHLYTVAFDIAVAERAVVDQLRECASDSGSAFVADGGPALIQAFSDITQQLQKLRLSR